MPSSTSGNRPLSTPEKPIPPSDLQTLLFWRGSNGIPFRSGMQSTRAQRSGFFECISDTDTSFSYLSLVDKFTYILCAVRNCNLIGEHLFKSRLQLLSL